MKTLILLITILLIGCTRTIYLKETIYINNTINITINKTIEIPCNLTCPECFTYNSTYNQRDRELELIRRLKFLENQQSKWLLNETELINQTKTKLEECNEELCQWNSSWC